MEKYILEVIFSILVLYPLWRIFKRAGLNPALSLFVLIPYVGFLVSGQILATSPWKLRSPTGEATNERH